MASALGLQDQTLSINLLPMTLVNVPNAVDFLLTAIDANGFVPEQIVVEFTESEAISRFDEFTHSVRQLKSAGISVTIDHFGAGFAGLQLWRNSSRTELRLIAIWSRTCIKVAHGRPLFRR